MSQNALTKNEHFSRERRALLAKVHIAIKDLGIYDCDYRDILQREYGVKSAKRLSNKELVNLIGYFEQKGWQPKRLTIGDRRLGIENQQSTISNQQSMYQVIALRKRAQDLIRELGPRTGSGLVHHPEGLARKVLRVDRIEWCRDAARLTRLLAILERIRGGA